MRITIVTAIIVMAIAATAFAVFGESIDLQYPGRMRRLPLR